MKSQALFCLKDKSKKLKCRLLQFLFSALRVKISVPSASQAFFLSVSVSSCYESNKFCTLLLHIFMLLQ